MGLLRATTPISQGEEGETQVLIVISENLLMVSNNDNLQRMS